MILPEITIRFVKAPASMIFLVSGMTRLYEYYDDAVRYNDDGSTDEQQDAYGG